MDEIKTDGRLDLRGVLCPMNYVKAKLRLEEMSPGRIPEVIIEGEEAVLNVPRSVKADGHRIIKTLGDGNTYRLFIRRN